MGRTLAAELDIDEPELRVAGSDGRAALRAIIGRPAVARLLDQAIEVRGQTTVITLAACRLTGIMEDQIRTELAPARRCREVPCRLEWVPAWQPADISDSGQADLVLGGRIAPDLVLHGRLGRGVPRLARCWAGWPTLTCVAGPGGTGRGLSTQDYGSEAWGPRST